MVFSHSQIQNANITFQRNKKNIQNYKKTYGGFVNPTNGLNLDAYHIKNTLKYPVSLLVIVWVCKIQLNSSQTGAAAVFLELWYRFVWAKYTHTIHERIQLKEAAKVRTASPERENTKSNDIEGIYLKQTIINFNILSEGDVIIDLNDLGTGNDEEGDEEDEESDGDEHDVRVCSHLFFNYFFKFAFVQNEKTVKEEDIGETSDEETETEDDGEMVYLRNLVEFPRRLNFTSGRARSSVIIFHSH